MAAHEVSERRLGLVLGLSVLLVVGQFVTGLAAHSVALLADAAHNLTDVAAVALTWGAVRLARRPATPSRTFGWHRGGVLVALVNAASVLAVTVVIAVESVRRVGAGHHVGAAAVAVTAVVAIAVNGLGAALLHGAHDHGTRSVVLHLASDALASATVLVAAALVLVTGRSWLDPAASLVVCVLVGVQGWRLLRESADVLLEAAPGDVEVPALVADLESDPAVMAVHDVHVWSLSSDLRALSAHVLIDGHPSLEQAQAVGERLKAQLLERWRIGHTTLELECEPCDPPSH